MKESMLVKGILFGAVAGAGISLLDRTTREDVKYRLTNLS